MRGLPCLLLVSAALAAPAERAAASTSSNPAFLGVGMSDAGGVPGAGPCIINTIERGSGAEAAQLLPGDVFERLDGLAIPSCDALVRAITSRAPGAFVAIDVRRRGAPIKVRAELLARDEILRRRLVGQPLPPTELVRAEDGAAIDLAAVRRTTIIGWFPRTCADCPRVLGAIARRLDAREARGDRFERRAPIDALAATPLLELPAPGAPVEELAYAQRALDVPLLAADVDTYVQFAMRDSDRVHFTVIDARGTVQYVAPIAPDTDDTAAMLDELLAAAEQIARRGPR